MAGDHRERWSAWKKRAWADAEKRFIALHDLKRLAQSDHDWMKLLKSRLAKLEEMRLLSYREHLRLKCVGFGDLHASDRERLTSAGYKGRHISVIRIADDEKQRALPSVDRYLRLNPGPNLEGGRINLQIIIDSSTGTTVAMNVQMRGTDPRRGRSTYIRYDLDAVQMGKGPVAHSRSHWHHGDDPDAPDAEDLDPRLPCPVLDPQDAIDVLVETFFPHGPEEDPGV